MYLSLLNLLDSQTMAEQVQNMCLVVGGFIQITFYQPNTTDQTPRTHLFFLNEAQLHLLDLR